MFAGIGRCEIACMIPEDSVNSSGNLCCIDYIRASFARLETRTKESNACASVRDCNPEREMKVKTKLRLCLDARPPSWGLQHRPAYPFVIGSRLSTIVRTRKMVSYTCAG